ncbi:MAG: prepilin-type N-terminal cleavage/methylation domain-containing protein, partial [Sedimentisphaerales bacterium]
MQQKNKGFTLVELMVVILIVGILAGISVPLMKARVDKSKWSEACTTAGTIRMAVRNYAAEKSAANAQALVDKDLSDIPTQQALGFIAVDLEGTYFSPGDYTITSVNSDGIAAITVTGGSKENSPSGSYILQTDGKWL